jgi:uncharacterized protein YggU (UPF0235/DUF167 family)
MDHSDYLKLLMDYFPTAVNTGHCLVFISEQWRVELREHKNPSFGQKGTNVPVIRVKIFKKALSGEFLGGHYVGRHGQMLKIKVAAPPEKGKANKALLEFLADTLNLKKTALEITAGHTSSIKQVFLTGVSIEAVESMYHKKS